MTDMDRDYFIEWKILLNKIKNNIIHSQKLIVIDKKYYISIRSFR